MWRDTEKHVHLLKYCLLITLLRKLLLAVFRWTLLERSLTKLLRSVLIKSLRDNIFIERLGFSAIISVSNITQNVRQLVRHFYTDTDIIKIAKLHLLHISQSFNLSKFIVDKSCGEVQDTIENVSLWNKKINSIF